MGAGRAGGPHVSSKKLQVWLPAGERNGCGDENIGVTSYQRCMGGMHDDHAWLIHAQNLRKRRKKGTGLPSRTKKNDRLGIYMDAKVVRVPFRTKWCSSSVGVERYIYTAVGNKHVGDGCADVFFFFFYDRVWSLPPSRRGEPRRPGHTAVQYQYTCKNLHAQQLESRQEQ